MAAQTKDDDAVLRRIAADMLSEVELFNRKVVGTPIPDAPTMLAEDRLRFRLGHMREELAELEEAAETAPSKSRPRESANDHERWAEQADALVDLIYVAMGTLLEMGVLPGPAFAVVHDANMRKIRGEVAKRPGSSGFDTVKPPGWQKPDVAEAALRITPKVARKMSPAFLMATQVRISKGQDYNDRGIELEEYFPFGHMSYCQMVHVKALRVRSLVQDQTKSANHESLLDSLVDLANYSAYWAEKILDGELAS